MPNFLRFCYQIAQFQESLNDGGSLGLLLLLDCTAGVALLFLQCVIDPLFRITLLWGEKGNCLDLRSCCSRGFGLWVLSVSFSLVDAYTERGGRLAA